MILNHRWRDQRFSLSLSLSLSLFFFALHTLTHGLPALIGVGVLLRIRSPMLHQNLGPAKFVVF